jgi:transcription elongation factor GreA
MADYPVLTEDGKKKLEEEMRILKEVKRKEIKKRIEQAKEHGDLSENAEYHDAREEQSFMEGRILEIESILRSAVEAPVNSKKGITVGSTVILELNGQTVEYTIVGSHESDPGKGLISLDSPLAQAFVGHVAGERVEVKVPKGIILYTIKDVK